MQSHKTSTLPLQNGITISWGGGLHKTIKVNEMYEA